MKHVTNFGILDIVIDKTGNRAKLARSGGATVPLGNREAADRGRPRTTAKGVSVRTPTSSPSFASKLEARYAQYLDCLKFAKQIRDYAYQPFSIRLPGTRNFHRPDFLVEPRVGPVEIHNTKGVHKNLRDSLTKIKTAAALHPWFVWKNVKRVKREWVLTEANGERPRTRIGT